jgi:hypothetical protein
MKRVIFFLALLLSMWGCTKIVDPVVVPLTKTVDDINETISNTDVEILPDTKLRIKNSGVAVEKNF